VLVYTHFYHFFNKLPDFTGQNNIAMLFSSVTSFVLLLGGAGEDRTPDPLRARQVLSQLSYDPNRTRNTKNKLNGHFALSY
jgi:hypothetical protein